MLSSAAFPLLLFFVRSKTSTGRRNFHFHTTHNYVLVAMHIWILIGRWYIRMLAQKLHLIITKKCLIFGKTPFFLRKYTYISGFTSFLFDWHLRADNSYFYFDALRFRKFFPSVFVFEWIFCSEAFCRDFSVEVNSQNNSQGYTWWVAKNGG